MTTSVGVKVSLVSGTISTVRTLDGLCCVFLTVSRQIGFVFEQSPTIREGTQMLCMSLMLNHVCFQLAFEVETLRTGTARKFLLHMGIFMSSKRNLRIEGTFADFAVDDPVFITVVNC